MPRKHSQQRAMTRQEQRKYLLDDHEANLYEDGCEYVTEQNNDVPTEYLSEEENRDAGDDISPSLEKDVREYEEFSPSKSDTALPAKKYSQLLEIDTSVIEPEHKAARNVHRDANNRNKTASKENRLRTTQDSETKVAFLKNNLFKSNAPKVKSVIHDKFQHTNFEDEIDCVRNPTVPESDSDDTVEEELKCMIKVSSFYFN